MMNSACTTTVAILPTAPRPRDLIHARVRATPLKLRPAAQAFGAAKQRTWSTAPWQADESALQTPYNDFNPLRPVTPTSTGVQPRLGPPLVDRDLAIVYPLLVHPFSA